MADIDASVVLAFHRFGPYHRARLEAVRSRLASIAFVEFSSADETYACARVRIEMPAHISVFCDADVDRKPAHEVAQRVRETLDRLAPSVLAVPGWSHPAVLRSLAGCLRNSRSAVPMSESAAHAEPRQFWREWIERRVVRSFAAALVAGLMHRVAAMPDGQRDAMGEAGRRIIADWGPERLADGLLHAVRAAMGRLPSQASWLDQALLRVLAHPAL